MTNKKAEYRSELLGFLQEIQKEGYTSYITKKDTISAYGHIISPSGKIFYIQRNNFESFGWTISIQYKPSKKYGSGSNCRDVPSGKLSIEYLKTCEQCKEPENLKYKTTSEFIENNWSISKGHSILV